MSDRFMIRTELMACCITSARLTRDEANLSHYLNDFAFADDHVFPLTDRSSHVGKVEPVNNGVRYFDQIKGVN
jgi:hypothetical protein